MILTRLFGRRGNREVTDALYERIVAAARQPALYSEWSVPDTPLGRFEMISLHMILFLHRVRGEAGAMAEVAQTLTEEFFADVDSSVRELGVGDAGVPKRVKRLARMFYGRIASYGDALDREDSTALAAALARNVRPGAGEWPGAGPLASYALAARAALGSQSSRDLLSGQVAFPDAGRTDA